MTEHDTNPDNLKPTQEDLIAYLVGGFQRIESVLADMNTDRPPKWAVRLFDAVLNVTSRIEKLEKRVEERELYCKLHHGNGSP